MGKSQKGWIRGGDSNKRLDTEEQCIAACPKPWLHMEMACGEFEGIMKCHRMCNDDLGCHESCPLPSAPKAALKAKGIIACNVKCGDDQACRRFCNRPVVKFEQMLGLQLS